MTTSLQRIGPAVELAAEVEVSRITAESESS
jgi:hypothetical protein